ncbi:hypothetical protein [uncultured Chryseobacterium sp.]|uniref:hypothetical protein n=1 Tax=uncultured Chryseobacterium sp. TaxID=259322 RepID=UPI0025CD4399|nr:hypothetical protein [uncultured Chryseobacterium sp.]
MKKHYSRKLKLLKFRKRDFNGIERKIYRVLFPRKFKNEKIRLLHDFVSKNDGNTDYWYPEGLLGDFIGIIKDFSPEDIDYFFETISLWDSYHLVVIADKLLENYVKESMKYDFGIVYCRIFCRYEKFDSYYLIDNLEMAINRYDSKPDIMLLIDLTSKIHLLFNHEIIGKQQLDYNLLLIKKLQNEL